MTASVLELHQHKFSLVWITKAFNLEWLLNLWERGKPQNKPSKKGAVTQLENANLKDTRRSRQKHIKVDAYWNIVKTSQKGKTHAHYTHK